LLWNDRINTACDLSDTNVTNADVTEYIGGE